MVLRTMSSYLVIVIFSLCFKIHASAKSPQKQACHTPHSPLATSSEKFNQSAILSLSWKATRIDCIKKQSETPASVATPRLIPTKKRSHT